MDNPFEMLLEEIRDLKKSFVTIPQAAAVVPPEIIDTEEVV